MATSLVMCSLFKVYTLWRVTKGPYHRQVRVSEILN